MKALGNRLCFTMIGVAALFLSAFSLDGRIVLRFILALPLFILADVFRYRRSRGQSAAPENGQSGGEQRSGGKELGRTAPEPPLAPGKKGKKTLGHRLRYTLIGVFASYLSMLTLMGEVVAGVVLALPLFVLTDVVRFFWSLRSPAPSRDKSQAVEEQRPVRKEFRRTVPAPSVAPEEKSKTILGHPLFFTLLGVFVLVMNLFALKGDLIAGFILAFPLFVLTDVFRYFWSRRSRRVPREVQAPAETGEARLGLGYWFAVFMSRFYGVIIGGLMALVAGHTGPIFWASVGVGACVDLIRNLTARNLAWDRDAVLRAFQSEPAVNSVSFEITLGRAVYVALTVTTFIYVAFLLILSEMAPHQYLSNHLEYVKPFDELVMLITNFGYRMERMYNYGAENIRLDAFFHIIFSIYAWIVLSTIIFLSMRSGEIFEGQKHFKKPPSIWISVALFCFILVFMFVVYHVYDFDHPPTNWMVYLSILPFILMAYGGYLFINLQYVLLHAYRALSIRRTRREDERKSGVGVTSAYATPVPLGRRSFGRRGRSAVEGGL